MGSLAYAVYLRRRYKYCTSSKDDGNDSETTEDGKADATAPTAASAGLKPNQSCTLQQTSIPSQYTTVKYATQQTTPKPADSAPHVKPYTQVKYTNETQQQNANVTNIYPQGTPEDEHTYSNLTGLFLHPCKDEDPIYMNVRGQDYVNVSTLKARAGEASVGRHGPAHLAIQQCYSQHIYEEVPDFGPVLARDVWTGYR